MKLNPCKKHNIPPFSFLFADHKNMTCKWMVRCTACLGLNEYESTETIFKVVYNTEIDEMRKTVETEWNINNQ